jgi:NitT/TauT family transport system substrate-binding protein
LKILLSFLDNENGDIGISFALSLAEAAAAGSSYSRGQTMSIKRLLLAFAFAVAGWSQVALADDREILMLDWIPTGEHAAYFAGLQRGFFKEAGIDLTITRGYGSGDTVNKVAAGAAKFGVADVGAVLAGRAQQSVPVKSIAAVYTYSPHSLFVLKSSGITGFKDLAGKKIAVSPGNSHRIYFPEVARKVGIDPESVTWVTTDASAMAAMLIAKRVDAAPFYSIHQYYQNKAAVQAGEEIIALPFVSAGFAIYASSLIATDDTIKTNPDLVRRFLGAAMKSFIWARDNPVETCKLHVQKNPEVLQDECEASQKATMGFIFNDHQRATGQGHFEPARLADTWRAVAESLKLDASWNPAQAVDDRFVP